MESCYKSSRAMGQFGNFIRQIPTTLDHNPAYKLYAEQLIKMSGKIEPEIWLSQPVGGLTEMFGATVSTKQSLMENNEVILTVPWPIMDLTGLYILAHETRHVLQYRYELLDILNKPEWLVELEAECFAMRYFDAHHLPISEEFMKQSKYYISRYINCDTPMKELINPSIPWKNVYIPDKNLVKAWLDNPYFTTEIKNLVP